MTRFTVAALQRCLAGGAATAVLAVLALVAAALPARAQPYPARPVTIIIPASPGGGLDNSTRFVAGKLQDILKQPVIVEARPGGQGLVAAQAFLKAAPDGHTLLVGANNFTPTFFKSLPFDPRRTLVPVGMTHRGSNFVFVRADHPARTVQELIAQARAQPGRLNTGYSTSSTMLVTELFTRRAGIEVAKVPYKGDVQLVPALISGELSFVVTSLSAFRPMVEAGKVRILGVSSDTRSTLFPDVPTLQEAGLPGLVTGFNFAYFVPAGTPAPVVDTLNRALTAVAQQPDTRRFLAATNGAEPYAASPEQTQQAIDAENAFYAEAARLAHFTPE